MVLNHAMFKMLKFNMPIPNRNPSFSFILMTNVLLKCLHKQLFTNKPNS